MSFILESIANGWEVGLQFVKSNWLWIVSIIVFWSTISNVLSIIRGINSSSWPTARGVIDKSHVSSHHDDEHGTMYSASIAYHYTVGGKRYRSSTIQFGREGLSKSWSGGENRIVENYPEGRKVAVHYQPSRPRISTLKTGVNLSAWIMAPICVALSGLMLFLCLRELILHLTVPLGTG